VGIWKEGKIAATLRAQFVVEKEYLYLRAACTPWALKQHFRRVRIISALW
jgi:hypothetical protein